ncbi:unnamed protein product [Lota lota]
MSFQLAVDLQARAIDRSPAEQTMALDGPPSCLYPVPLARLRVWGQSVGVTVSYLVVLYSCTLSSTRGMMYVRERLSTRVPVYLPPGHSP